MGRRAGSGAHAGRHDQPGAQLRRGSLPAVAAPAQARADWSQVSRGRSSMRDAFICDAVRTPIGRYGGVLASVRPDDLGAVPIKALMERNSGVDWATLD